MPRLKTAKLTKDRDALLAFRLDRHRSRQYNASVKRRLIALLIVASLGSGGVATMAPPAYAFTGHHCTISTCRFFTSSYSTARYYYDRRTCDQWKSLGKAYLHGFRTKTALLNKFPKRKLHPPC